MRLNLLLLPALAAVALAFPARAAEPPPHVVLVMADDLGWGQTGYNGNPVLKTPELDAMAAAGLRFDRFYAGAPNCSPTRATVLTGRSNDRTGVLDHGYALRRQEKTLPQAMKAAGYATAHFGKWHLSGLRGPGAPVLAEDDHNPGAFGFDEWLSVTNFFDRDPLLSRKGKFEALTGDSSEVVVAEALTFLRGHARRQPTFTVIWFGSPHDPFRAAPEDKAAFASLDARSREHYGEIVALDRSIGALRRGLRELGIAENTFVLFCSDNGGLPNVKPSTVGPLRGFKNTVYEGGLRVPAIAEWPARIKPARTSEPVCTMDIFPTLAAIVGLPRTAMAATLDGTSFLPLLRGESLARAKPIPFRHQGKAAWIDGRYKLLNRQVGTAGFELYDLVADPHEAKDLAAERPELAARLEAAYLAWSATVDASAAGKDYPEGKVHAGEPTTGLWRDDPRYQPHLDALKARPELRGASAIR